MERKRKGSKEAPSFRLPRFPLLEWLEPPPSLSHSLLVESILDEPEKEERGGRKGSRDPSLSSQTTFQSVLPPSKIPARKSFPLDSRSSSLPLHPFWREEFDNFSPPDLSPSSLLLHLFFFFVPCPRGSTLASFALSSFLPSDRHVAFLRCIPSFFLSSCEFPSGSLRDSAALERTD